MELVLPIILVQIPLLHSPSHIPIMTKLALTALLTSSRLEKLAQYRLGICTKRDLLRSLHGVEKRRLLLPTFLLLSLLLCSQILLPLLGESFGRLAGYRGLRLDLSNLLLNLGRFVFLYSLFFRKRVSVHAVVGARGGTHVLQAEGLRALLGREVRRWAEDPGHLVDVDL